MCPQKREGTPDMGECLTHWKPSPDRKNNQGGRVGQNRTGRNQPVPHRRARSVTMSTRDTRRRDGTEQNLCHTGERGASQVTPYRGPRLYVQRPDRRRDTSRVHKSLYECPLRGGLRPYCFTVSICSVWRYSIPQYLHTAWQFRPRQFQRPAPAQLGPRGAPSPSPTFL